MKRLATLFAVVVIALAAAITASGCHRESASSASTETIAPAAPQPGATDSDAMTQTVDIEDSRSEADGAALTTGGTTTAPGATTTTVTTTTVPTTNVPPKPKKQ